MGHFGDERLKPKYPERIEKIKEMLLQLRKYYEMAKELGVNRRTVYRDIKRWEGTPDYEAWLRQQFPRLYAQESDKSDIF